MEEAAGLLLAIAGALLLGAGAVLQVPAARSAPSALGLRPALLVRLSRSRRWMLGAVVSVAGWLCQVGALLVVPLTLVTPAAGLSVVVVVWAAPRRLGDLVGRADRLATFAIVAGVGLTAATAPARSGHHAGGLTLLLVVIPLAVIAALPYAAGARSQAILPTAAGASFALCAIATKLATDSAASPLHALLWLGVAAGTAAAGGIGEMTALRTRTAAGVVAVVFAVETVVPILAAPILFDEHWSALATDRRIALAGGICLVLAGVAAAARSPQMAAIATAGQEPAPTPTGQETPVPPSPQ